jgi:RNA polymerase sigma-B factor
VTTAVRTQETQTRQTRNDKRRGSDAYAHLTPLFHELADPAKSDEYRRRVREQLVSGYMNVASHIAHRFTQRGQPLEDLTQVAALGLINAVDRFDPARGKDFLSFAVPTITGEVRRYFRDHGWSMRVPRRLQELRSAINKAVTQLGQELGRAPTAGELAKYLDVSVEDIYEGYQVGAAYRTSSLDELASNDEDSNSTVDETIGTEDERLSTVDDRAYLYPAMAQLSERERTIVGLRFFDHLTQTQIANKMNMSQMHVSRLLSRSLATLRTALATEETETATEV